MNNQCFCRAVVHPFKLTIVLVSVNISTFTLLNIYFSIPSRHNVEYFATIKYLKNVQTFDVILER